MNYRNTELGSMLRYWQVVVLSVGAWLPSIARILGWTQRSRFVADFAGGAWAIVLSSFVASRLARRDNTQ